MFISYLGMDIRNSNNFVVYTPPTHRLIADKQIPNACVKFATEKQGELLEKGIGRNFMTHLIALCDFGLISPAVIRTCMGLVLTAS